MRWIALFASFFVLTGSLVAAGADDQYLDIYNQILQGDSMLQAGQSAAAAARYAQAQAALVRLHADLPSWNPSVVQFRLDYLASKLAGLSKFLPTTNAPPIQAQLPAAAAERPASPAYDQQIAGLQEQIRVLTDANADYARRLKEALSVQPAAVSPAELTKAQEKIVALQKEKDLLTVALEQEKAAHAAPAPATAPVDTAETQRLRDSLAEAQRKLTQANSEIETLRAAQATPAAQPTLSDDERDKLKAQIAQLSKDLADSEAHQQAAPAPAPAPAPETTTNPELEQLQAKIAVLEANPVPLTPEESAVLKESASKPSAATAAPSPQTETQTQPAPASHRVVHSSKDLPPGAGALMADAARASMERDYDKAEQKYLAVLSQDENNVYVLAYLANAQYAAGHLAECEKTVQRALALDPNDPASLFLLGILRYRQDRLDDAFTALSQSARLNPTNAGTQNFLGCVLADKGLRPAAETALRKALQVDPDYADAHYNLALVYSAEKPPSLELAKWHYKRALELGHPKSDTLEKLLSENK